MNYAALYKPLTPGRQVRVHSLGMKTEPIVTVIRPLREGDFTGGCYWQVKDGEILREIARAHLSTKLVKETFVKRK